MTWFAFLMAFLALVVVGLFVPVFLIVALVFAVVLGVYGVYRAVRPASGMDAPRSGGDQRFGVGPDPNGPDGPGQG